MPVWRLPLSGRTLCCPRSRCWREWSQRQTSAIRAGAPAPQDILLIVTTSWQNFANVKETSRRAAEMPLMRGLWLLRPRTSSLKVAIKVKLRLTGVNNSIIIFVDQSSRSFILGMFSVLSLKSRLPELGHDTRRSTTMSSLGIWHCCERFMMATFMITFMLMMVLIHFAEVGKDSNLSAAKGCTLTFSTLGDTVPSTNW